MNIMEISAMQSPIKMREEVANMAKQRNCTEDEIWSTINGFRRIQVQGKKLRAPIRIGGILKSMFDKTKISESPIEDTLKYELLNRDMEFETQAEIGKYRVDFLFPWVNLIVEADGREYHSSQRQRDNDFKRQLYLIKKGYTVLRFSGSQIYGDVVGCVDKIQAILP